MSPHFFLVFAKNVRPRTNLNVYFNDSQEKVIEYVFLIIVFYFYLMTHKKEYMYSFIIFLPPRGLANG